MSFLGALTRGFGGELARGAGELFGAARGAAPAVRSISTVADTTDMAKRKFSEMVEAQRNNSTRGCFVGYHCTTPENAVNLLETQQFLGKHGGVWVGSDPEELSHYGGAVLKVVSDSPVYKESFGDHYRVPSAEGLRFIAHDYNSTASGTRHAEGSDAYDFGFYE